MAMMVLFVVRYLEFAVEAIRYPFGLDYGEGSIWQQMTMIPGPGMYGDINHYPFVVFQYTPVYHLLIRLLWGFGYDPLMAGRAISFLSALVIGLLVGVLSNSLARPDDRALASWMGAGVAALSVLCYAQISVWSLLMRVDMLAIMFSVLGVWLALARGPAGGWMALAMLAFVLAVYTKQSSILGALAVLPVLWFTDRRRLLLTGSVAFAVAFGVLVLLIWMTNGGFVRHAFSYNVIQFDARHIGVELDRAVPYAGFSVLALSGLWLCWRRERQDVPPATPLGMRERLRRSRGFEAQAVLSLYFLISSLSWLGMSKSGSAGNYVLEWFCVQSVWVGVLVTRIASLGLRLMARAADSVSMAPQKRLLPVALVLLLMQALTTRAIVFPDLKEPLVLERWQNLVERIKTSPLPVLSDDMVLLRRAGKEVPWEPFMFTELARLGRWDERLILDMITRHEFAFVITSGERGDPLYDSRFSAPVDDAIERAYPVVTRVNNLMVRAPSQ